MSIHEELEAINNSLALHLAELPDTARESILTLAYAWADSGQNLADYKAKIVNILSQYDAFSSEKLAKVTASLCLSYVERKVELLAKLYKDEETDE